jgi:hypothetical protein
VCHQRTGTCLVDTHERLVEQDQARRQGIGARLLPIEVKATNRPRLGDAANLRTFRAEYGKKV